MTDYATNPLRDGSTIAQWPRRAESWLDARGRGAWIVAAILGFVMFWPVGLALVVYMAVTGKWSMGGCARRRRMGAFRGTGNTAFDSYKAETLRRLQEEQDAFESFLDRLRAAKDKAEFDEFMEERARAAREAGSSDAAAN